MMANGHKSNKRGAWEKNQCCVPAIAFQSFSVFSILQVHFNLSDLNTLSWAKPAPGTPRPSQHQVWQHLKKMETVWKLSEKGWEAYEEKKYNFAVGKPFLT